MPDEKAVEKWKKTRAEIEKAQADFDDLNAKFKKLSDFVKRSPEGKRMEKELDRAAAKLALAISKLERFEKDDIIDMQDEDGANVAGDTAHLGEAKRYDDAEFKNAFNNSIDDWAQNARIALNTAHSYMISMDSPDGLKGMDVFDALSLVIPHPAVKGALSTTKSIITLLEKAYKSGLPKNPDVNDIHQKLDDAFNKIGGQKHDAAFEDFWKYWKGKNKIEVEDVWTNMFLPACADFAKDHMNSDKRIAKAFLKACVDAVADDDFFGDLDGVAGVAYIELTELVGNYSNPKGYLDDVPKEMVASVKQVWKHELALDLPFQLHFSIRNTNNVENAVIKRSSTQPGGTGFKLAEGDAELFESFMRKKAYQIPKVSHLKAE